MVGGTVLYVFDKDLTLVDGSEGRPANTIAEQQLLPGVAEKCAQLSAKGHALAVASNQGGVAYGFLSEEEAGQLVEHAAQLIGASAWRVCPHHPKGRVRGYNVACSCRKPAPGMILEIMQELGYERDETIYVGDMESDEQAARAAGVRFEWAKDFFG